MPTAKELREQQSELYGQMEQHRDKITADGYEFRAEDETAWQRMNTEFSERETHIRQIESADDILAKRNDPEQTGDPAADIRNNPQDQRDNNPDTPLTVAERAQVQDLAIVRFAGGELTTQQRALLKRGQSQKLVSRNRRDLVLRLDQITPEFRAAQARARRGETLQSRDLAFGAGTGNAGTLGPETFISSLERNMLAHGQMLQLATVIQTDHGRTAEMPTVDDTGNEADIVGEAADVSATQDPTIGEITWPTYKLRSKKVKYSTESAEDSVFDLPGLLGSLCGERIGRGANRYLTTGTGTGQPHGVVTEAGTGFTLSAASYAGDAKLLADAFISLFHSVDPAYRTSSGIFMLHDSILAAARKIKNSNGDYLFRHEGGIGERIHVSGISIPYSVNNHMDATIANGNNIAAFGDLSKYWARVVRSIRVRRYVELHGDNDQDALQVFLRIGGRTVNAGTNPIKKLVIAA